MYVRGFSSCSISSPFFFSFEVGVAYPCGLRQCSTCSKPIFTLVAAVPGATTSSGLVEAVITWETVSRSRHGNNFSDGFRVSGCSERARLIGELTVVFGGIISVPLFVSTVCILVPDESRIWHDSPWSLQHQSRCCLFLPRSTSSLSCEESCSIIPFDTSLTCCIALWTFVQYSFCSQSSSLSTDHMRKHDTSPMPLHGSSHTEKGHLLHTCAFDIMKCLSCRHGMWLMSTTSMTTLSRT